MAAPHNPPNKNEDFAIDIFLTDVSDGRSFKANPTIAAGDFKVKQDSGSLSNLSTLPAVSPAGSVCVRLVCSASEMNGDVVTIVGIDQTNPKEWVDFGLSIPTTQ